MSYLIAYFIIGIILGFRDYDREKEVGGFMPELNFIGFLFLWPVFILIKGLLR